MNENKIRTIAFYLPQFHVIPENDEWWGKGFTEWTNVKKAKPLFEGHYQSHVPSSELGYYDLSSPDVLKKQSKLALDNGIFGFCFYYYWFNGKKLLDLPLRNLLNDTEIDLPFCICWANENWTRRWDGQENDVLISQKHSAEDDLAFINELIPILKDERYIRINGKPLIVVYRTGLFPDPRRTSEIWRKAACENGIGEIYLARVESFTADINPEEIGFDAAIEFAPDWRNTGDKIDLGIDLANNNLQKLQVYDYKKSVNNIIFKKKPSYKMFRCVYPSWDNTPRCGLAGTLFLDASPENFEYFLKRTIRYTNENFEGDEKILFINAWNEWGEGCHLEPDEKYGKSYLNVCKELIKEFNTYSLEKELWQRKINILKVLISSNEKRIEKLENIISEKNRKIIFIESSKFWKLRFIYLKIKGIIHSPEKFIGKYISETKNIFYGSYVSINKEGLINFLYRKIRSRIQVNFYFIYKRKKYSYFDFKNNFLDQLRSNRESIILISHDACLSGAPINALNMAKTLNKKFNINVVTILIQGGSLEEKFSEFGPVICLNQEFNNVLRNKKEIDSFFLLLKNEGVKRCICNSVVTGILLPFLEKNKFNYINLIHEQPGSIKKMNLFKATKKIVKYSKRIIFSSNYVRNEFRRKFGMKKLVSLVRPQGVYLKNNYKERKGEARELLRKKLGFQEKDKIILGCGYADIRKGIDLFFEIANRINKNHGNSGIKFVWLGGKDQKITTKLLRDAKINGYDKNIVFCDFEEDPSIFFAGSDIFLLTSREDPFPTVVLEAMDCGVPVIAFKDSGGIQEILLDGNGILVPYLDICAMSESVDNLINNQKLYENISEKSKKIIEEKFVFEDYISFLLKMFERKNYKNNYEKLKVSVIVPNYNYQVFLKERLNSIINQTLKPLEIIFLDDNSNDKSISVAEDILSHSNIPYKIIKNDANQGCFSQWIKGIKLAKGDLVWIAEADDFCKLTFLETLLQCFLNKDVVLAYCQSEAVDSNGNVLNQTYHKYTNELSNSKWHSHYENSGNREMNDGLAIKNTIPNASAVLIRKDVLQGIEDELNTFRSAGDWFTYIYVLRFGKIAYVDDVLNSHRRHALSIIDQTEKSVSFFKELIKIQKSIVSNFIIREDIYNFMLKHLQEEYVRLNCSGGDKYPEIIKHPDLQNDFLELSEIAKKTTFQQKNGPLTFVIVAPDFEFGGGQIVAVEQANYLSLMNKVILYNARPDLRNELLISKINSSVEIAQSKGTPSDFYDVCQAAKANVVISQIWWSDKLVWKSIQLGNFGFKWILIMHGCYEMLVNNINCDRDFDSIVVPMLERADQVIYTADKNLEIFKRKKLTLCRPAMKLKNGIVPKTFKSEEIACREDYGIEEDAFVFFICSRAIPEKGWEQAIDAIKIVRSMKKIKRSVHLFLIGDGDYAKKLKLQYANDMRLHFLGNRNDLHLLIPMFDACLLPTYFCSESQPMIIINSLAQEKPVIATAIGEIPEMLHNENVYAGLLVPIVNNKPDMKMLVDCMARFVSNDKGIYTEAKKNCSYLFKNFNMQDVAAKYIEAIDHLIA